jgi:hypothetical protein
MKKKSQNPNNSPKKNLSLKRTQMMTLISQSLKKMTSTNLPIKKDTRWD